MPHIDQPSAMKTGDLSEWGRPIWILLSPLSFEREGREPIIVPAGFKTDFASVLRLPFMFWLFGDTAHASAVVHDWLVEQNRLLAASRGYLSRSDESRRGGPCPQNLYVLGCPTCRPF